MFWFFRLWFRRAYDSAYDSDFWFSLGHKFSYDSDSDSVASENQPLQFERHPESSSEVTLLLHADWMMLKNASNRGGANSVTVLSARNPGRGCWSLRKLPFWKIIWQLALGFSIDLRLNTTRRSIHLSVCLVFDLVWGFFADKISNVNTSMFC